jgi:hypothetical protein
MKKYIGNISSTDTGSFADPEAHEKPADSVNEYLVILREKVPGVEPTNSQTFYAQRWIIGTRFVSFYTGENQEVAAIPIDLVYTVVNLTQHEKLYEEFTSGQEDEIGVDQAQVEKEMDEFFDPTPKKRNTSVLNEHSDGVHVNGDVRISGEIIQIAGAGSSKHDVLKEWDGSVEVRGDLTLTGSLVQGVMPPPSEGSPTLFEGDDYVAIHGDLLIDGDVKIV